ncbi:MAG: c-type cytochrome [Hyphomicrobiaceae bacterium]|nr:c-type cytochrome [Hyphomicrobiaceae bacterium]
MGMHALFVCGLTALLLVGCDSSEDVGTQSDAGATVSAEAPNGAQSDETEVARKATPAPIQDTAAIEIGKAAFDENCAPCHQPDAIGSPGVAPSLTNPELLATASDEFLLGTIWDGRVDTGMPPFEYLGKEKIGAIVAYLRSHTERPNRSKEIDAQPAAHGDPRLGKLWFENICATCHGVKGDGYESGGTGTAIGKLGFLDKASDGFIRTTIKQGRSNTRMRGFNGSDALANLSDQEIDDIIVYLRSLAQNQGEASNP